VGDHDCVSVVGQKVQWRGGQESGMVLSTMMMVIFTVLVGARADS
jgi:hypothetical protein